MTEFSCQYGCSSAVGDYGPLSVENLAIARLLLGNKDIRGSGVIYWTDSSYVPQVTRTVGGGLSNAVDGLLEPTESSGVVTIDTGVAIVNGYLYLSDESEDFDIDGNPGNANATDIIALQWIAASQTIRLARIAGAAASTAVLTQTSAIWEIPLAEVALDGSGQFSSLTDVRQLAVSPGTVMKIEEINGDGVSTTIGFSNIQPIFQYLKVVGVLSGTIDTVFFRLNSLAGTNYDYTQILGRNSTLAFTANQNQPGINLTDQNAIPDSSQFDIFIYDYKNENIYTTIKATGGTRGDGGTGLTGMESHIVHGWVKDTSIITDIDFLTISSSAFNADTKITLYGVV